MLKSQKIDHRVKRKAGTVKRPAGQVRAVGTRKRSERESLTKRLIEIEPEIRAALASRKCHRNQDDLAEGAELRALVSRANLGGIFEAVILNTGPRPGRKRKYRIISSCPRTRYPWRCCGLNRKPAP